MTAADDAWTEALATSQARTTEDWFKSGFAAGRDPLLELLRDLVDETCPSHDHFQATCPVCRAASLLRGQP